MTSDATEAGPCALNLLFVIDFAPAIRFKVDMQQYACI